MALPATSGFLAGPGNKIEYLVEGEGTPVTVVGHGLTRSMADTRGYVLGARGTLVYLHFRGHGGSTDPGGPWEYPALAEELRVVAGHTGATRGVAVSLSCRVLAALALEDPGRFDRLVFVLPPALFGEPSSAAQPMIQHLREVCAGNEEAAAASMRDALPRWVAERDPHGLFVGSMVSWSLQRPDVARSVLDLIERQPPLDLAALAAIDVPTLVVGEPDDAMHPLPLARAMAEALPRGTFRALGDTFPSFSAYRRAIRAVVLDFLDQPA